MPLLHAGCDAQQHLVVELQQLAQCCRSRKLLLQQLAHVRRIGVSLHQLGNLLAQRLRGPAQVRLQDLAHVHTGGHAERIQHDLHRRSIGQIRHVFLRKYARNHALVAVAAGHLVAHAQLALHGHVNLHQLDHARRQLVALLQLGHLLVGDLAQHFDLPRGHLLDLVDLLVDARVLVVVTDALQVLGRNALDGVAVQNRALGDQALVGALVVQVGEHFLAAQNRFQALQALVGQNADLVAEILFEFCHVLGLDQLGALILLLALAAEDAHVHHRALDAGRAGERGVAHVAGLFAENRPQQLLFRRQLGFALGRHLAHQNVAVADLGADADHAAFIEIPQRVLAHVGYVARDLLGAQLGVAGLDFELLDVHRGVVVLAHQPLADKDGVLKVVAAPGHESHQHVTAQRQLALLGARPVGNHLALHHALALADHRLLIDAGVLIRPLELDELVDVGTHLARQLRGMVLALDAHDDALGVHRVHDAVALGQDHGAGVARGHAFHARTHQRSLGCQQRHALALHVGAHQCAVGVVVLEERHQRSGHRDQLLGADVDVVDLGAVHQHKVALPARVHQIFSDLALVVEFDIRLGDGVPVFLPRGKIEAEGNRVDGALARLLQLGIQARRLVLLDVIAHAQAAFAGVDDLNEIENLRVLHLAVRRLDKSILIDARKATQRADESDVRTFRRLDRANAAVVRGVHVAHLEARALARQPARPQSRKPPLVRDLRQRIGLVHELRELRGAEELADRRHHRLGVDEVVRHGRVQLLIHAHLFLDGALHAHQADAELVFHQLAHGAHAAVAQMVDIVHHADVLAQLEQVADGRIEILRRQRAMIQRRGVLVFVELDVELEPAHAREIVLARIEEHAFEERRGRIQRGRVARPQLAVDLDQRLLRLVHRVALQRVGDDVAHVVAIGEEDLKRRCARGQHLVQPVGGQLHVGLHHHFAGGRIHHVGRGHRAIELGGFNFHLVNARGTQRLQRMRRDLAPGVRNLFLAVQNGVRRLYANQVRALRGILRHHPLQLAVGNVQTVHGVEGFQDLLVGTQPQRAQKDRSQELALAVDAHIERVLLVVLEFHPRTAIGNDLAQEVGAAVGGLKKDAGRAVQLRHNHALGAIHNKRAVRRHQRNVAEEDFLLLNVADGLVAGLGVLVVDGQAHRHLQRRGEGHAPLLALLLVVLQLQAYRIAALVAEVGRVFVVGAALLAEHVGGQERIRDDHRSAMHAGRAQVVQALQVSALALPVADREVNEVQLRDAAEVRDREDRHKHRLQSGSSRSLGSLSICRNRS